MPWPQPVAVGMLLGVASAFALPVRWAPWLGALLLVSALARQVAVRTPWPTVIDLRRPALLLKPSVGSDAFRRVFLRADTGPFGPWNTTAFASWSQTSVAERKQWLGRILAALAGQTEAIASTIEIARRCAFRPLTCDPILPSFAVAGEDGGEAEELRRQARDGLRGRLATAGPADGRAEQEYWDRLEFELDVIISMNFPGYFLIVADFIQWAKAREIPVGPGRGSGAGTR